MSRACIGTPSEALALGPILTKVCQYRPLANHTHVITYKYPLQILVERHGNLYTPFQIKQRYECNLCIDCYDPTLSIVEEVDLPGHELDLGLKLQIVPPQLGQVHRLKHTNNTVMQGLSTLYRRGCLKVSSHQKYSKTTFFAEVCTYSNIIVPQKDIFDSVPCLHIKASLSKKNMSIFITFEMWKYYG